MPTDGPGETTSGKDPFNAQGNNVENEARKTMDSTWDSPFHSIGKGSTQAASGSHKHKYAELEGVPIVPPAHDHPHNHDTQYAGINHTHGDGGAPIDHKHDADYINSTGDDQMNGQLTINNSKGLTLHSPGDSVVSLGAQLLGGRYVLEVTDNWDADTGNYATVEVGPVVDGNSAINYQTGNAIYADTYHEHEIQPYYYPMRVSGPHGPVSSYKLIDKAAQDPTNTVFHTALASTCLDEGITRVTIAGYIEIRNINSYSRASLSAFVYPWGYWYDGTPFQFTNGNWASQSRFTLTKKPGISAGDYGYENFLTTAFFVNRPGQIVLISCQANVDNYYDGQVYAQFGHMRVTLESFENAEIMQDGPQWLPI